MHLCTYVCMYCYKKRDFIAFIVTAIVALITVSMLGVMNCYALATADCARKSPLPSKWLTDSPPLSITCSCTYVSATNWLNTFRIDCAAVDVECREGGGGWSCIGTDYDNRQWRVDKLQSALAIRSAALCWQWLLNGDCSCQQATKSALGVMWYA